MRKAWEIGGNRRVRQYSCFYFQPPDGIRDPSNLSHIVSFDTCYFGGVLIGQIIPHCALLILNTPLCLMHVYGCNYNFLKLFVAFLSFFFHYLRFFSFSFVSDWTHARMRRKNKQIIRPPPTHTQNIKIKHFSHEQH